MKGKITCLFGPLLVFTFFMTTAQSQAPRVAVLDSANTKEFFARHYLPCTPPIAYTLGAEEYQRYFRGWEHVLQTNSIPHAIIHDEDVTRGELGRYELLILSNTASLSDDQEREISQWVRRGGRLLATFGSGYKDIVSDPRQIDKLKLQKGGTNGLHQLWHDPLSKLFSTLSFTPAIDVRITRYAGPTSGLQGLLINDTLPYGALGNLLIQRPENHHDVSAFLKVPGYDRPAPAILSTEAAKGRVIYFAFAPEYLVSKEYSLPKSIQCDDGQNWAGRSTQLRILMRDSIWDLLSH